MTQSDILRHSQVQTFIEEVKGFSDTAEKVLEQISSDLLLNKGLFSVFADRMLTIRGTAMQLGLSEIAHIAGLGEEISLKAVHANSRSVLRKCVGSLWDAQTTIKYLLEHYLEETNEEQKILIHRLQATLRSLGGARPTFNSDDIEGLLSDRK